MIVFIGVGNTGRILLERLTFSGIPTAKLILCDSDSSRANKKKTELLQQELDAWNKLRLKCDLKGESHENRNFGNWLLQLCKA